MLGIEKHVIKLVNSTLASYYSFEPIQNQTEQNKIQNYSWNHGFGNFLAYIEILGIKKHVLKLGIKYLFVKSAWTLSPERGQMPPEGTDSPPTALCKS